MFTIDRDGDGVNDSEEDGIEPLGVSFDDARKSTPDVSTLGTRLKSAIETAGHFTYRCDQCRRFLLALNKSTHHDTEKILDGLMLHGELPVAIRDRVGGTKEQRVWLRAIVESVIAEQ